MSSQISSSEYLISQQSTQPTYSYPQQPGPVSFLSARCCSLELYFVVVLFKTGDYCKTKSLNAKSCQSTCLCLGLCWCVCVRGGGGGGGQGRGVRK